jgi:hypothetical protein
MRAVHESQTEEMQELLIREGGKEIHPVMAANPKLRTLWNEYFVEPWACWGIGTNLSTPLNISNNQPIESWHKGVMRTLQKALKGTTAAVLEHSFPKLVHRDGAYRTHIMLISCISIRINLVSSYRQPPGLDRVSVAYRSYIIHI